jgi:hypothetical protein
VGGTFANGQYGRLRHSKDVSRTAPAPQNVNNDGVDAAKTEADE